MISFNDVREQKPSVNLATMPKMGSFIYIGKSTFSSRTCTNTSPKLSPYHPTPFSPVKSTANEGGWTIA